MSSVLGDKTIMDPDLTNTLGTLKTDIFRNLNCVKPGEIESFDASKKTAQVKILFKRVLPGGNVTNYPVLVDCPVITIQGGGSALQLPIATGDQCLLFFSDRNIDAWFKTGSQSAPLSTRAHDLSDGFALVGINALTSSLENYQSSKVRMFYSGVTGGELALFSNGFSLKGAKNNTGSEVSVAAQIVTIKNATTSLLVILDGLIDVLAALQVTGPLSLTAPSIAALNAYKVVLATLLA